jgi:DNA-binding NarL/FixJ family response regulator
MSAGGLSARWSVGVDADARVRMLTAHAHEMLGDRDRAIGELRRAHRELDLRGAVGWRDQAAGMLRRLGRRVASADGNPQLQTLSRRQLEVCELVSQGVKNREIAAQLVVSEKTVESHLERIFDRLSISTRAELVLAVEQLRATAPSDQKVSV